MSSHAPNGAIDYKTLVQDDRIHASLYTDPQVFDDEMERIFRRGWSSSATRARSRAPATS